MKIIRYLCCLWFFIPYLSMANEATDFASANRSQQISLLEQWAIRPDANRLPLLEALRDEKVAVDAKKQPFIEQSGQWLALSNNHVPQGTPKKLLINNRLRIVIRSTLAAHQLVSPDQSVRLHAAQLLADEATTPLLPLIEQRLAHEPDPEVLHALRLAAAKLQLQSPDSQVRLRATQQLADSTDPQIQTSLEHLTDATYEPDAAVRAAASASLKTLQHRLLWGDILGQAFSGLSLGSILLLAALGLAITYGLLGVINMAHGEMLMIGAYATWLVQSLFSQLAPAWLDWYLPVALPVAFIITALLGMLLERTIIRHLYGRPLETLLATWGISLVLIQLVRVLFGTQNLEVANPSWLSGGLQVLPNLVLPYSRIAVIGFVLAVLLATWMVLNKTRLGLNIRAVTQNRAMAACCGVPTGRIDMLAFGLGSGIAGLGGVALSQLGNVGPELGQGYIIDSFLVVVLGGVGQLAGTVVAAFGLGILNKVLEPQIGAVLGKILILVLTVVFIQKRPQGLFAFKGRNTD